ncbi:MAG TPA: hypothetical protein VKB68_05770 [Stellaceae bacterium]|nr:hypothetical protein [Stellaceae bacterium]
MSEHRYPTDALVGDYARAGAGLVLAGAPLLLVPLNIYVEGLLGGLAALFACFGGLTALRHARRIEVGEEGIAARGPFPVRLAWGTLEGVNLRYFATRRDGSRGWMELKLRGSGRRLLLDSRIDGFNDIAQRTARAAAQRHLTLTPATAANFTALGIPMASSAGE